MASSTVGQEVQFEIACAMCVCVCVCAHAHVRACVRACVCVCVCVWCGVQLALCDVNRMLWQLCAVWCVSVFTMANFLRVSLGQPNSVHAS